MHIPDHDKKGAHMGALLRGKPKQVFLFQQPLFKAYRVKCQTDCDE